MNPYVRRWRCTVAVLAIGLISGLSGCETTPSDPVTDMLDPAKDVGRRIAAAEHAAARSPDDAKRIKALHAIAWKRNQPAALRRVAIDQLLAHDEAAFRAEVRKRIARIMGWDTLRYLFDLGARRGWQEWPLVLVHSYARTSQVFADDQRPEREALKQMRPQQDAGEVALEMLRNERGDVRYIEQVAAWELLVRLWDDARLRETIADVEPTTNLIRDLQAAQRDLGVLPRNKEELLWLLYLRQPAMQETWAVLRDRAARSPVKPRAMRHLPVLLNADAQWLASTRQKLVATLQSRLRSETHYDKGVTSHDTAGDHPQRLADWLDAVDDADLVAMLLIRAALDDRDVQRQLFAQAEADRLDTDTEYGGALLRGNDGYEARAYEPLLKRLDTSYSSPPDLIIRCYTSLAHYHFHAQRHDNAAVAGPGAGDLKFAARLGLPCIVLTYVDAATMNVDYYHSGGVRVDLGVVRRR